MSTYRLYYTQQAESHEDVEADSYDEAIDKSKGSSADTCWHCSRDIQLGGDWEPVEDYYSVDGEFVDVKSQATS